MVAMSSFLWAPRLACYATLLSRRCPLAAASASSGRAAPAAAAPTGGGLGGGGALRRAATVAAASPRGGGGGAPPTPPTLPRAPLLTPDELWSLMQQDAAEAAASPEDGGGDGVASLCVLDATWSVWCADRGRARVCVRVWQRRERAASAVLAGVAFGGVSRRLGARCA